VRHRRRPYRDYDDDDPDSIGATLAAVNERLDDLSLQVARIARRAHAEDRRDYDDDRDLSNSIGKALAQFNRRLDEIVGYERAAARTASGTPRIQSEWLPEFDRAPEDFEEHTHARRREPAAAAPMPPMPSAPIECTQDLSGLENQLRKITEQIADLNQPCRIDDAVVALRTDLAEISRAFNNAMPRQSIELLEKEVRALAERIDRTRESGLDSSKLAALERGLVEVRDSLRNLKTAENLVEVNEAVKGLSRKVDQINSTNSNPATLQKLDQVIAGLRGMAAHVASNDAIGKLAAEVRNLAAKIEQPSPDNSAQAISNLDKRITALLESTQQPAPNGNALIEAFAEQLDRHIRPLLEANRAERPVMEELVEAVGERLERRIQPLLAAGQASPLDSEAVARTLAEEIDRRLAPLMNASQSIAPELTAQMKALSQKIEGIQLPQGDKIALSAIENRIVALAGKLDESGAWLGRLDAIERGMADLLVYLEDLRTNKPAAATHAPQAEVHPEPRRDSPPESPRPMRAEWHEDSREPPRSQTMRSVSDLPTVETAIQAPAQPSAPAATPEISEPVIATEHVIGSSTAAQSFTMTAEPSPVDALNAAMPGAKSALSRSPARRPINPDLPPDTPIEPAPDSAQLRASAAERISASEAALGGAKPAAREVASQFETLIAARRAAFVATTEASTISAPVAKTEKRISGGPSRLGTYVRWVLLAASIIIIVLGALKVGMDMWGTSDTTELPSPASEQPNAGPTAAPNNAPAQAPTPMPSNPSTPPQNAPAMPSPEPTPNMPPLEVPTTPPANGSSAPEPLDGATAKPVPEVTGALPRADQDPNRAPAELPATIGGPGLRAAANTGNPAAEYEIAVRYAEGRGVTVNIEESARWLDRAAKSGFAPAQFRLGSLYDKGGGLKRDRALARQYYTAAAEKGHAKAMHNLAVLYAEGIDGKPNYRLAAQWFRKAAEHGIADSQYNLAILYIRGIGVEQNLAEAYKWFALAANQGDQEAIRKREEVAERLDEATLAAAQQMVQSFVIAQQPDQAISLRAPPGGWDRANAATQPTRPKPPTPDPLPKSLLSPQPL
jgi:localization factor PodJL